MDQLYRCTALACEGGRAIVAIHSYDISRRTPCGFWIKLLSREIWVKASGKKRFAHPTKEEAIESFKARKHRQIKILQAQMEHAWACLDIDSKDYIDFSKPAKPGELGTLCL